MNAVTAHARPDRQGSRCPPRAVRRTGRGVRSRGSHNTIATSTGRSHEPSAVCHPPGATSLTGTATPEATAATPPITVAYALVSRPTLVGKSSQMANWNYVPTPITKEQFTQAILDTDKAAKEWLAANK